MELSDQELEHLERLARVKLSGEARERLRAQLARIIELVQKLQTVDTAGLEPRAYVGEFKPELRADEVKACLPRDEILAVSPDAKYGFYAVPPVIEADEL